jgi:exopolysaccharide biosynthesis polyprenyl glycosylphosphotransferase
MDRPPPDKLPFGLDIRAPQRLELRHILSWRWQRVLVLVLADVLGLAIAWQVARYFNQFYSPIPAELVWWVWFGLPSLFWVFAGLTVLLLARRGLYGASNQVSNYLKAGKTVSLVFLLALVISYFYDPEVDPPRSLFLTAWVGSVVLVVLGRLVINAVLRQVEQQQTETRVFLIAPAERLQRLSQVLARRAGCRVVGAALASTANSETTFRAMVAAAPTEVLVEGLPNADLASGLYWRLRRAEIPLKLLPSSREMLYRRGVPEVFAGLPVLRIEAPLVSGLEYRLKRGLDFLGAGLGVLVLAPVFVGIAIAIKWTSPGPIFFRQERMGLHGKVFQVWKFRTMGVDAPDLQAALEAQNESDGVLFKIKADPRITSVGHLLRRTSLDELPQLFNILLGQMSLVGPRPLPLRDVAQFDPWHHIRHQVLPGITGLWQVSGRSDIESFDDAARLDLHYIDNWSLNLDLEIMVETLRIILFGHGAY